MYTAAVLIAKLYKAACQRKAHIIIKTPVRIRAHCDIGSAYPSCYARAALLAMQGLQCSQIGKALPVQIAAG